MRAAATVILVLLLACPWAPIAHADVREVSAGGNGLARAVAAAAPGDVLRLAPGIHQGGVTIDKPLTLEGPPGHAATVDAGGTGSALIVAAPEVTVRGLTLTGSGVEQHTMDAGVLLQPTATGARIIDNRLTGNLYGVYVQGPHDATVEGNDITGRTDLPMSQRGNGITVWNAPGARIVQNRITGGRDGIFANASRQDLFQGNRMAGVRFAIHYMYTNDSRILDNVSVGNDIGFALMFSDRLEVRNNQSMGDNDYGLLLNYANASTVIGNRVTGRFLRPQSGRPSGGDAGDGAMMPRVTGSEGGFRAGTAKCVFVYNANKNRIADNRFDGCDIGIHFTAGAERNTLTGNAFIGNRTQVMYVGTRSLNWSDHGRGNYWSDNPAFDLNGDGIADEAYRPNDLVDRVVWRFPAAKLLLNSPAIQVIRWAQAQFPALHPGGVVDSAPLMKPPPAIASAQP
ncbi:nitrous oxide reductase family maturation protein NosD [Nitrospirillum viridazoti]|uniref:Carbohydrate-binding protein n=1 Tax=Nitrospirillum viridazoti CBAmc TaxID=1441467 RepID=A0A248JZP0_9PROT|nr:nitrous oxide reductase family maturation protein NosD [Nitrospirillum amazonense]ASG24172.1 carbohydrate-binding protein [Nitrospirillum amazonense CBAmc]TWB40837.1 nitrous oxidase accessory protein [Nitrospirillum amazonense]